LQNGKFAVIPLVIILGIAITNGVLLQSTSLSLHEIHLVRCLTYIGHKYFAPGRTLVISSPSTYRDMQQERIAEFLRTSLWPVVYNVDGHTNNPDRIDFIGRYGSLIILVPDGNYKSFNKQILGLILDRNREFNRIWNSETRFVVAGVNKISVPQQLSILNYFSKFRIYNCIIVSPEHYVEGQKYRSMINVNDVDTGMKLGVYTWFPYQSSDRCTDVNDITLLDSGVISAQGHFTKNTDFFPGKISNNLHGCRMKAIVRDGNWYFTTKYVPCKDFNGNVWTCVEGVEMKLLRVVLKQMNVPFFHVSTPKGFERGSIGAGKLSSVMFGKEAYIALGDVGSRILFLPLFDTTNPHYVLSVRWYVPCSVKYSRWSSFFRILSVELWVVLIISIVIAAISTTCVGRYSCTSEWQVYKAITSSLTSFWAVLLGVGVSAMPRSTSVRLLFFAWVCFSLAFNTVFQAFLTTYLIDSGYETPIQNMDEMFDSGIKLGFPPEYYFIFRDGNGTEASKVRRNHVICPSYAICAKWATYQKNISILVADMLAEALYASGDFVGENSEPLICRLEDGVVFNTGLTMVMLYGDPLMKRVSEIIDRVVEAGLMKFWISSRIHLSKVASRKIALVHPLDEYYSFNLYHMQAAFYMLFMGWGVSAICFMFEALYNRILIKRQ
jgi:hypothetical protein